MAKGGDKGKGKKAKVYGPSTVLKPVIIGMFVLTLLQTVLPIALGGS
jgi:hypothetical protein